MVSLVTTQREEISLLPPPSPEGPSLVPAVLSPGLPASALMEPLL